MFMTVKVRNITRERMLPSKSFLKMITFSDGSTVGFQQASSRILIFLHSQKFQEQPLKTIDFSSRNSLCH